MPHRGVVAVPLLAEVIPASWAAGPRSLQALLRAAEPAVRLGRPGGETQQVETVGQRAEELTYRCPLRSGEALQIFLEYICGE